MFPHDYFPAGFFPGGFFPPVEVAAQPPPGGGGPPSIPRPRRLTEPVEPARRPIGPDDEDLFFVLI